MEFCWVPKSPLKKKTKQTKTKKKQTTTKKNQQNKKKRFAEIQICMHYRLINQKTRLECFRTSYIFPRSFKPCMLNVFPILLGKRDKSKHDVDPEERSSHFWTKKPRQMTVWRSFYTAGRPTQYLYKSVWPFNTFHVTVECPDISLIIVVLTMLWYTRSRLGNKISYIMSVLCSAGGKWDIKIWN